MAWDDMADRVGALGAACGLPVSRLDAAGQPADACGHCGYCAIFRAHLPKGESCEALHAMAARRAADLGEAYMFACHAGLCHIVQPLTDGQAFRGAVLAGPFLLGPLDATLIQEVAKRYPLPTDALLELYEAAGELKSLSTAEANALIRLLGYLFEGCGELSNRRARLLQQQKIGESIQMYKGFQTAAPAYPYEKERALVLSVQSGDAAQAKALLNDLLGYALFSTGGGLEVIKSCTAELCALLSRAAIEAGLWADDALYMNRAFMRTLWQAATIEDLCLFMQDAVERFCRSAFPAAAPGERASVASAVRYIRLHYAEPLTLSRVAREAHLSDSYFSTVFKKCIGSSFREYLAAVRVEEAKRLLRMGDRSVTEIALGVGFESQSYFSKVFRRLTGEAPKDYQKKLHVSEMK
ncbi:MAG: helix-turn-helix domain-containing protein [Clostridiales bacterium]|nr:helix-turn-helix domain-containing protein [Clostridiales bacterium]